MVFIRKLARGDTITVDGPCRIEVDRKKPRRIYVIADETVAVKLQVKPVAVPMADARRREER